MLSSLTNAQQASIMASDTVMVRGGRKRVVFSHSRGLFIPERYLPMAFQTLNWAHV